MKKSVLFITNAYPDFDSSYRGIFIKKMATLLQEKGYQISVVTPKIYKRSCFFEESDGIKVYRFPFLAGNKLLIEYKKVPYLKMVLYYLSGILLTFYVLLRNRSSLIHAHWAVPTGIIGALVGMVLRKPLVVTVHGSDLRMAVDRPGIIRKLFRLACKKAIYINCVSEAQEGEIRLLGIPSEKIKIFPMGVEEAFFEAEKTRSQDSGKRPFTIISNRNLLPIYNVSLLVRAIPMILREIPGARFLIAGEGVEKEKLEKEALNLGVTSSVEFLGRVPHEEMPELLSQADVYVSTSLTDGTSVSLLEAMACGNFPVVTDIVSNREWVHDGENGFLVPTANENILAAKIIDALRNGALVSHARLENQRIIKERAYVKGQIDKLTEIYAQSLIPG
jgi:L-malate glycosyltransferase